MNQTGTGEAMNISLAASVNFLVLFCAASNGFAQELHFPALNPPVREKPDGGPERTSALSQEAYPAASPSTEWTFHKTADGSHPDGHEQQILWLMNRARANPAQEGEWLASSSDSDVAGGRDYFKVDLTKLKNEFAALAAKPPAAFDNRLYAAAYAHSSDLIARDAQDHDQQFVRIDAAGFHYSSARGSVFSYADSGLNAHAAWNIDWGPDSPDDGDGMQASRGHRKATMSIDGDYTNAGIAAIHETSTSTKVGEHVTTGNYCNVSSSFPDHYNVFIVGTVWSDSNGNNQYDPGEGKGNVEVRPDQGSYYAVTGDSGGYAIPVLANGTYSVTFSGADLSGTHVKTATVNGTSVLLDLETGSSGGGFNLSVNKNGSGTVTSSPAGISCGGTCSASFTSGQSVTLTAIPASGYIFVVWGGVCVGTTATCTVIMNADTSATATFSATEPGKPSPWLPAIYQLLLRK